MAFEIKTKGELYDVCIVGSGAGGGMAAKVLAESGIKVALLEAGPDYDPANPDQQDQQYVLENPGRVIHEVSTTRWEMIQSSLH